MKKTISILALIASLGAFVLSVPAFAKEISLYEQPKDGAKVVGTVDLTTGVIPIFSPKEGDWMKVGDPRNGNVGWVKSTEMMNNENGTASFSFTQKIVPDSKGVPHSYQLIQYGKPAAIDTAQIDQTIKKIQIESQQVQQSMQSVMQNMINQISALYKQQGNMLKNTPVILPIVVMPPQKAQTPTVPVNNKQEK